MMRRVICSAMGLIATVFVTTQAAGAGVKGAVKVDGSSTVFPITEAIAEEFNKAEPRVRVTVGVSGTGGGFKKFGKGEIDINDASRPIKGKEIKKLAAAKVEYLEIPVAYDGLSVIVNKKNTWAEKMTPEELHKIWMPGSKVTKWSDVRPEWPKDKILLYGPGTDSGTFDYFTEAINGKSQRSRSDFTKSEDDNVLVIGVSGDKNALGYFGYAYYKENKKRLKVVAIKNKDGKYVRPEAKTINDGTYNPLSRPLFVYVNKASLKKPAVYAFMKFYLENAATLAAEVGYVALPSESYKKSLAKLKETRTSVAKNVK